MTPEQAIQNLENLVNVGLQRGLFQNAGEVQAMVESLNVLRPKTNQMHIKHEGVKIPDFTVTTTSDKIPENAKS